MGNKMLIDAGHSEETRVVVARSNNRIEELDYEAAARKQLRGNIYLAKVTRVEPSLQAAFVDYGGNRHGFLAFNEIHPDYYQIPIADRQALLEQEAAEERAEEEEDDGEVAEDGVPEDDDSDDVQSAAQTQETDEQVASDTDSDDDEASDEDASNGASEAKGRRKRRPAEQVESVGGGDAMEDVPTRKRPRRRSYKIQEVIKRRQIILVQVVKEERGNKGAALTTYLSLAGRYCVLMPNTARGGGISRKITDVQDRKRLKDVAKSANVPDGMGLIVRTAGANRTKAEVKRDFDYLLRLWENVRDLTLESTAPCLVYEEGSLIKRAIRDLYTKDIDSIIVEGEEGYKEAKEFMRMLMPSHARNIKAYKETQPLFMRYSIETQLDVLFSPYVTLPSGGYIVINQTEALVSIDVNSGKATKEHNIEDTALKTNLEAADEVSRQMRLRDLAGLIVIDFIDMEERRNNRSVERRLKERLKSDRARIQVGRISHFGLLEMSRQRMRSGVLESSTKPCPTCEGRGFVRSVQSASLQVLRGLEDYLQRKSKDDLIMQAPRDVALYILNQKRDHLLHIESQWGISIFVEADDTLLHSEFAVERVTDRAEDPEGAGSVIQVDSPFAESSDSETEEDGNGRQKKRRRRRGRRGTRGNRRDDDQALAAESNDTETDSADTDDTDDAVAATEEDGDSNGRGERKSKRGSRGGRRRRSKSNRTAAEDTSTEDTESEAVATAGDTEAAEREDADETLAPEPAGEEPVVVEADAEGAPKPRKRRAPRKKRETAADDTVAETSEDAAIEPADDAEPATVEPDLVIAADREDGNDDSVSTGSPFEGDAGGNGACEPEPNAAAETAEEEVAPEEPAIVPDPVPAEEEPAGPPRRGWWQRR